MERESLSANGVDVATGALGKELFPASGNRAQGVLNKQLVEDAHFLIGVFGSRFGTPTGVADSGTLEEIEQFVATGRHVALYFSNAPIARDVDRAQLAALEAYQRRRQEDSLYATFRSVEDLRRQVAAHLPRIVASVQQMMRNRAGDDEMTQREPKHNIVFLNAEVVKLAYSGPGFSERTDGQHSFSEVKGVSTGDMFGLVARFRNEAVYGEDVATVRSVRAHLKLFDRSGKEIGTGFSSAQWLGHPNDTFDLIPNGRGGSVIVCRGGKTAKPLVMWKAHDARGRLRDRDLELNDGYPGRAEITLMDSNNRPLLHPVVLDITESAGGLLASARQ